ncbi:MAG: aminotransferase class IV [Bacteroidetes bacterium]|nr:aminotransferase class IV [Bacteroidota bacterium]
MKAGKYILLNEKFYLSESLMISPFNRSFRYGDGFFETMKFAKGEIVLGDLHFERLFSSLEKMYFKKPSFLHKDFLISHIQKLIAKNKHSGNVRIRITLFRGNGSLFDPENLLANVLIETSPLEQDAWHKKGLVCGIYQDAKKTADQFSPIKSNNFLPYLMAAFWAKKNHLDDAILLNNFNRIADATIANVFLLKEGRVVTPSLAEGCIAGVMRKYFLGKMHECGIPVEETAIEPSDLELATEVFLTNSIFHVRWVKQIGKNHFKNAFSHQLWKDFNPIS